jgi:MFS family permease
MQLLAPDILSEGRGLSIALSATGLVVGVLLWLFGWRFHRFWIVLAATLCAGVWGMACCPVPGAQPLVVGLLVAVAAGALALSLVHAVLFAAGGITFWVLVHALTPTWADPVVCVVAGGLTALVLMRFWTMLLTSFAGALLMGYSALLLVDRLGKLDASAWAEKHAAVLSWSVAGVALVGWVAQFLMEMRRLRVVREREAAERLARDEAAQKEKERKQKELEQKKREKDQQKQKEKAQTAQQKATVKWWEPFLRAG